jgi:hypothetical protein
LRNVQAGIAPLRELGLEPGTDVDLLIDDHHMNIPHDQHLLDQISSIIVPERPTPNIFESSKGQTLSNISSSKPTQQSSLSILPDFPHNPSLPVTRLQIRYNTKRHVIIANKTTMLSQIVKYIRENITKTGRILVGVPAKDISPEDGTLEMHSMLDSIITIQQ